MSAGGGGGGGGGVVVVVVPWRVEPCWPDGCCAVAVPDDRSGPELPEVARTAVTAATATTTAATGMNQKRRSRRRVGGGEGSLSEPMSTIRG
jgi:hypothetical protein